MFLNGKDGSTPGQNSHVCQDLNACPSEVVVKDIIGSSMCDKEITKTCYNIIVLYYYSAYLASLVKYQT